MLGITIEFFLSFLLLNHFGYNITNALGLRPDRLKLLQFVLGVAFPVFFYCLLKFTISCLVQNPYRLNNTYTYHDFFKSLCYVGRAVLYEELIFRGALLYLLVQRMGSKKALLISCTAFGIYHWFSWQVFGNPSQMLFVFLSTASGGFIFALAFVRIRSVYLPIALHLGCNMATMLIFAQDKIVGTQLLIKSFADDPVVPSPLIAIPMIILHYVGFQIITWLILQKIKYKN